MDHHIKQGGAVRQSSVSSTTQPHNGGVEDIDDEAWLSKYLPDDLLKLSQDPEATLEFVRTHNPLMSQMSTFLSRKLRMVLTRPGVASVHHNINANNPSSDDTHATKVTTSSLPPKAVLTARLFCAAADGDVSLLADTTDKIRLWYQLTQDEERERKEASEVEAHQRAKKKAEAALQKKHEQAQLMEERDARRALTTTMLAVQLKDEEEYVATGVCRTKSSGFGRTFSSKRREAARGADGGNPNSIMMSSATTAHSIRGVMSGEWDEWPKDTPSSSSALQPLNSFPSFPTRGNQHHQGGVQDGSGGGGDQEAFSYQSAFSATVDNAPSVHDPSSRRSSLVPTASVSRAGSMEFRNNQNSRRRSSGYYLSDQLRRIYSVPSMAGSGCDDEDSMTMEVPLSGSKNHLLSANNLTVHRGVVASTRRGSTIDHAVDFMHDDSSDGGGSGKDEDVFDAGAEQARNLEALERAISNAVPFLHMPFNILHYAAYSNSPEVVEYILANQDVIEKLGATVSASAQARVYRYNANKQIAQAASMAQAKARPGMGNLPPHNDPSSIHYYTHFADGKPVLTNHIADGSSPLHIAAAYNNPQMLRLLLAAGGDCKLCRGRSITPLYDCMWLPSATLFTQHVNLMVSRVSAIRQVQKYLSAPPPPTSDQQDDLNGSSIRFLGSTLLGSGSAGSMTLPMLSATYGLSATYNDLSALSTPTNRNGDATAPLLPPSVSNIDLSEAVSVNRLLLTSGLHTTHIDGRILTSPIPWRKEGGTNNSGTANHPNIYHHHNSITAACNSSSRMPSKCTTLPYGIKLLPVPTTNEGITSYGDTKKNSVDHTTSSSVSPEWMFDGAKATDGGSTRNAPAGGTSSNHQLLAVSGAVHPPFHAYVLSNPLYASIYLLLASGSDPSFGGCGAVYPPIMESYLNPLQSFLDDDQNDTTNNNNNNHNTSLQEQNTPSSRGVGTPSAVVDALTIDSINPDPADGLGYMNSTLLDERGAPPPPPSTRPLTKASLMRMQTCQNPKYSEDLSQFLEAILSNVRTEELVQRHRRAKGTAGATGLTTLTGGVLVGVEPVPVRAIEPRATRSEEYTQQLLEATTQSGGHPDSNELSMTGNSILPTSLVITSSSSPQRKGQPSGGAAVSPTVENSGASAVSQFLRMRFLLNQSGKTGIPTPNKKRKVHHQPIVTTTSPATQREPSPQPSGGRPPLLLPAIQAGRPSSSRLSVSSDTGIDPTHAGSHSLSPKSSSGPAPNLVGFSLPPVRTDRPSLCFPPAAVPGSPVYALPSSPHNNQDGNSPSAAQPPTAITTRNAPPKKGPPIPVKVGDFVAISSSHFKSSSSQSSSAERVTGAVAIRLFDETVARSTVANIPSRYVQLQADACVALIQKRQVGMPSVEIDEYYRQHSAALKSAASGSPSSPTTKKGLFKDKARLLTHTVGGLRNTQKGDPTTGGKTTPLNVLRRQSMAVSFAKLPRGSNTTSGNNFHPPGQQHPFTSSTSHMQVSELDGSGSGMGFKKSSNNKFNSRHRQSISQLLPLHPDKLLLADVGPGKGVTATTAAAIPTTTTTKCNLSRGFHTLLGNSVIGKVSFVGKLPNVVLTRWLKSRSQSTTLSPSFEGLVSNNPSTFNSALGSMLNSLQQHKASVGGDEGDDDQSRISVADEVEWFVGIVLEHKMGSALHKQPTSSSSSAAAAHASAPDNNTGVLGNCDGTYFGTGKRYFSAVETVGAQLRAETVKNLAVESKRHQQQQQIMAASESSSLSRSNSIVRSQSFHKSQVREAENTAAAFEQMVVACNGERCALFIPICLIDMVFTSTGDHDINNYNNMSDLATHPLVSTQVSENTEVRRRWTSSWKQAIAKQTKRSKSPTHPHGGGTKNNVGEKRHGFTDAAKELKLLLRDYNAKKKAEEMKFNSRN